jgi:bifunctional DNase/RNase
MVKSKIKIAVLITAILFIVCLIAYLNFFPAYEKEKINKDYNKIFYEEINYEKALSLEGFVEAEPSIVGNNLVLTNKKNKCEIFSAEIIEFQAYSILNGINNQTDVRPTIHDIVRDIIEVYDFEILLVKVAEYNEGIYYGNLILRKDGKITNLDIKPSDAIAIAVRTNNRVYVNKKIFTERGENIC